VVDLLAKAIEEDSFEICTEGMPKPRTVDELLGVVQREGILLKDQGIC
jgi:hypothetical protein